MPLDHARILTVQGTQGGSYALYDYRIHDYTPTVTSAINEADPQYQSCAKFQITDTEVTDYEDGMLIHLRLPTFHNIRDYGTGVQINSLGWKPIVVGDLGVQDSYSYSNPFEDNDLTSTSNIWLRYNGNVTNQHLLVNNVEYNDITGRWEIIDYGLHYYSLGGAYDVNLDYPAIGQVLGYGTNGWTNIDSPPKVCRNLTGTAGTSSTTPGYRSAKWCINDPSIGALKDGMMIIFTVPVAGIGTYGVGLSINGTSDADYHPIVYGVNSTIGTRYAVNSIVIAVYNSSLSANLYFDSTTATSVTGIWQVMDYSVSDTNTLGYLLRTNYSTRPLTDKTGRYRLLFSTPDNTGWIPASTGTSTNSTGTRVTNTRPINPFGRIVYYGSSSVLNAGANVGATYQFDQNALYLGYSFNRTGAALTLTYPAPVYIKAELQNDGSAIIDADTPYVQALPSTNDGKIYIYLGQAYNNTAIELVPQHPIYYHDGTKIQMYYGHKIQDNLSQLSDVDINSVSTGQALIYNGTNWSNQNLSVIYGTQGTQGTQGIQGYRGTQGVQGSIGTQGYIGTQGTQGEIGPIGTQGYRGTQGIQGYIGTQGYRGTLGTQGLMGNWGTIGTQGVQGPAGGGGSSLPSQSGHANEYLMTNGTNASWNPICIVNLYS